MDLVLVSITAISLVLAVAMGIIVFKLLREERQRSDARVALLAAAVETYDGGEYSAPFGEVHADIAESASEPVPAVQELFAASEQRPPWKRRLVIGGGLAALVLIAGYAAQPDHAPTADSTRAPVQASPLELLQLRHTQEPDGLRITGVVQNPPAARPLSQIWATAFLFGPDGGFLASGRAQLDLATLAPGDESPFVIKVPTTGIVSRYRVGFRGPDGAVIAHVDRRADGTAARNRGTTRSMPWVQ